MPTLLVSEAFDFNSRLTVKDLHMALPELKGHAPLPPLETDVGLLWARPTPLSHFRGKGWGNILSLLNVCLIMLIVLGLSCLCLKLRYGQLRVKCWAKRNVEPTTEALPLNDKPHVDPPATQVKSGLWPVLPPFNSCRSGCHQDPEPSS